MHFHTAALALLASVASAAPHIHANARNHIFSPRYAGKIGTTVISHSSNSSNSSISTTASGDMKSVVYWGQSQNKPLDEVCKQNVDTVVLAFVNQYGNMTEDGGPDGNPGWICELKYGASDNKTACSDLGKKVSSCQAAGKKVLMSVGGWIDYSLMTLDQGKTLADGLWSGLAEKGAKNMLGGATVDGFDFDIEHDNDKNKLASYVETVKELRTKIGSSNKIITGAPMCVPPVENVMTDLMKQGQFDELYFQFYNNRPCGANDTAGASDAWDQWTRELAGGASKNAKMFLGLLGGTGATSFPEYYIDEPATISLVNKLKSKKAFSGTMVWDAGSSMNNTTPSGNYLDTLAKAIGKKQVIVPIV